MKNLLPFAISGILILTCSTRLIAQDHAHPHPPSVYCGTLGLNNHQRQLVDQQADQAYALKKANNGAFTSITYVPIRPHILRRSDGTGGMSLSSINQVIAITNSYYLLNGYGIQFYFCGTSPDYVDNDQQYDRYNNETLVTQGHDATNAMNQYYVHSFASGAGGYAYYPSNSLASTRSFILNEYWNENDMGNRLIPHELGHNFNLVHTFGELGGGGTLGSGTTAELVTRGPGANCTTAGDYICDTPADPYNKPGASLTFVDGCPQYNPNSTAVDANGEHYAPSISNIMSYYFPCSHNFTPGQYDRMQAALALRQSHTAYTLDCPPTVVTAPSNVTALLSNNTIVLNWQDNAVNEMGYFIERSLAANSGFVPIGGVGPNTTTFIDSKISPGTVYYYRVKPSNVTTGGISPVVSIRSASCNPSYIHQCAYNDGLSSVAINGVLLSQNSGCSPNGYGKFTTSSTTVVAGTTFPVSGTLLSSSLQVGVTVWADLDRDGLFDASRGELMYQTPNLVTNQFDSNLTLPSSLTVGSLDIRVIVAHATIPNDPCGAYTYGETEDYVLNVVDLPPAADLSISMNVDRMLPSVNQEVIYIVSVSNNGPDAADGVHWQNKLPEGLVFVNGDPNVTGGATVVSGSNNISLGAGQTVTFTYQLQPTLPGTYINAAQIISSNAVDPDSQPNSG
ncbi:GEVED domain-containing protein, partial [Spirosoma sp.]|uniref:GEVED domain-containing protein n=1 Tax=Spirosoma sp. TaxID=1899569 RepID=UPI003B3B3045